MGRIVGLEGVSPHQHLRPADFHLRKPKTFMSELILGYDVRELCFDPTDLLPPERREVYLLKHDVAKPLSVDTIVWPSLFDTGQGAGMYRKERDAVRLPDPQLPPWLGPNYGLWESLADMLDNLDSQFRISTCKFAIIAITLHAERAVNGDGPPYVGGSFVAGDAWHLLGYDVADASLLSGLSNCGYPGEEIGDLTARWSRHLNEHHLFDDPEEADVFRRSTDQEVPEHKPFYVYGVWRRIDPDQLE
jgi:hypothetical protein